MRHSLFYVIPLTILPLIVFNIAAFSWGYGVWDRQFLALTMVSGQRWVMSIGDLMVLGGIVCLFFEVLRSTSASSRAIVNHTLSTLVFVIYLIEFIVVDRTAHSVFFILMLIALFDTISGFWITVKTARRDFDVVHPQEQHL